MSEAELTCGLVESSCSCIRKEGHDEPHLCSCEGSWTFDEDGEFVVVNFPNPARRPYIV